MTRVHLAVAFLLSIAGLAALAPHPAVAGPRPAVMQLRSSPDPVDGVAAAWLRGAPQPAKICPPGMVCCEFGLPQVCLRCAPHC